MGDNELLEKFKKEHFELQRIEMEIIASQMQFEDAQDSSNCSKCEIGKDDLGKPFESRYQRCKKNLRCGKTVKKYTKLARLEREESEIEENYALSVYNYLAPLKPELIHRQTKEIFRWEDVYSTPFKDLEPGLKTALVAMVENVGGRYRIVDKK